MTSGSKADVLYPASAHVYIVLALNTMQLADRHAARYRVRRIVDGDVLEIAWQCISLHTCRLQEMCALTVCLCGFCIC